MTSPWQSVSFIFNRSFRSDGSSFPQAQAGSFRNQPFKRTHEEAFDKDDDEWSSIQRSIKWWWVIDYSPFPLPHTGMITPCPSHVLMVCVTFDIWPNLRHRPRIKPLFHLLFSRQLLPFFPTLPTFKAFRFPVVEKLEKLTITVCLAVFFFGNWSFVFYFGECVSEGKHNWLIDVCKTLTIYGILT